MDFVFLYGAPAVGKLTVGRELARLTGVRLFDNHLVVDAALVVGEGQMAVGVDHNGG